MRMIASLLHWLCQTYLHISCCLATTFKLNLWMNSQWKSCLCLTSCLGNGAPPEKFMKVTHLTHYGLAIGAPPKKFMKVTHLTHHVLAIGAPPKKFMKVIYLTHYGLATACTHAVVTYDRGHKMVKSCPLGMIRFKSCSPPLWTWHN